MGQHYQGIPTELAKWLKTKYKINNFIETGTYVAETALWASGLFKKVYTIEASELFFKKLLERDDIAKNITLIQGTSENKLLDLSKNFKPKDKVMFWLDAHWSVGDTYGETKECPIIEEIRAINTFKSENIILIDDARLFLTPPPKPHKFSHWPNILDVLLELHKKDRYSVVYKDIIISVPDNKSSGFKKWIQNQVTLDRTIVPKTKLQKIIDILK